MYQFPPREFDLIPFTTVFCAYRLLFMLHYAIFTINGVCEFIINKQGRMKIKSLNLLSIRELCCLWACYLYYLIVPTWVGIQCFNPLNTTLNPICHLLALLEAHHILHISRIRLNIYGMMSVVQLTVLYLVATLSQYCRFIIKFLDMHLLLQLDTGRSPSRWQNLGFFLLS